MKEIIVSPSILSMDYSDTQQQLEQLMKSKATWMHFDVMDGHFVPNLTFGPDILFGFKKKTSMFMDVHLMVSNPFEMAPLFIQKGADLITFHMEAMSSLEECTALCKKIKGSGCQCGVSLSPSTPIESVYDLLEHLDLVLLMSVEPGFGGQSFIPGVVDKIKALDAKLQALGQTCYIEVDGGIDNQTGALCVHAGANVLVAGSYVFKGNIIERVDALLCQK